MKPKHSIPHNAIPMAREKLLDKITKLANGCWIFQGYTDPNGYSEVRPYPLAPRAMYAHRVSYEVFKGPIPEDYTIDHLCRRRNCVNPDHLEAVPHGVNVRRGNNPAARNKRKTHCKRGHEFTPENTYPNGRDKKGRGCRECLRLRNAGLI